MHTNDRSALLPYNSTKASKMISMPNPLTSNLMPTVVPHSHKAEAQLAIDELLSEHLIPFKLKANKIACDDPSQYTVWFFDSRLHSVIVPWNAGQSFKEKVRTAVLDRVSRFTLRNVAA